MTSKISVLSLAIASTAFAVSCSDDKGDPLPPGNNPPLQIITKTSALNAANANVRNALVGFATSSEFTKDSDFLGDLFPEEPDVSCVPPDQCPEPPEPKTLEEQANEIADEIASNILHEDNVELEEDKKIVLLLPATKMCGDSGGNGGTGGTGGGDDDCQQMFTNEPVRLELTSRSENNIDVEIRVGDAASPLSLELYQNAIAVEVDIAGMKSAVDAMLTAANQAEDILTGTFRGRVRAEVKKNGNSDYTAIFSILSSIALQTTIEEKSISFNIAQASPAATLQLNGIAEQITISNSWSSISADLPLAMMMGQDEVANPCAPNDPNCQPPSPPPEIEGNVQINIAGITGTAVLDATDELKLTDLGYGSAPLSVTIDNQPFVSADLNPNHGRKVNVTLQPLDDGVAIKTSPLLDFTFDFDLRNYPGSQEDMPSFLMDETISLLLDGAAEPAIQIESNSSTEPGGITPTVEQLLKVNAGTLTLQSRSANTTVTVPAPQCLLADEADPNLPEAPHPFTLLAAGTCQ